MFAPKTMSRATIASEKRIHRLDAGRRSLVPVTGAEFFIEPPLDP